jgi:hypothetical protein
VTAVAQRFVLGEAGIAEGTLAAGGSLELNPGLGTAAPAPYAPEPPASELVGLGSMT